MKVRAAAGGILGPAAFIASWAVLGARQRGYDPVQQPISRLAEVGAPTRVAMTAGFLAFTAGVLPAATALRRSVSAGTGAAAAAAAVATAAVGALPLGASFGDAPHAVAAGSAYAALALTPLAGAVAHHRAGDRRRSAVAAIAGVATAVFLGLSAVADQRVGLWQRTGLVIGDIWIALTCASALRGRALATRPAPAR